MLPFLRLSGVVSGLIRLGVIALVGFFIIQQFGQISFLGTLDPYGVFQVVP